MPQNEVVNLIKGQVGKKFSPKLTDIFLNYVNTLKNDLQ